MGSTRAGPSYETLDRLLGDFPLTLVRQQPRSVFEREPAGLRHLVPVRLRQFAQPAAAVADEIEGDDLEDALARPRVDVADVAELPVQAPPGARLLLHLPERGLRRVIPGCDEPLRERPHPRRLSRRTDRRHA